MADITPKVTEYVHLCEEERRLKALLDDVQTQKSALEPEIIDYWMDNEIQSQKIGGVTLYPHRQVWASHGGDPQRAVAAMRAAGLEDLITVNSQTLSAYVRERQANGEPLPEALDGAILVTERVSLRTRRS